MKNKLKIQELITIGIYTAIYFAVVSVGTLISFLTFPGFASIFTPAIIALLAGPIFFLLSQRIPKFGAITLMGTLAGSFFLISGHFALSFFFNLFFSLLADLVVSIGKYQSKFWRILGYTVFSYGMTGPIVPLWFMKDAYVASLVQRGKNAAYITKTFSHINSNTFYISMGAIFVCGIIGGLIGFNVYQKHFSKMGKVK